MGYRKKSSLYTLRWPDDHKFGAGDGGDGLEVVMKGASLGTLAQMQAAASRIAALLTDDEPTVGEAAARLDAFYGLVARRLVSWNLEDDDGAAVPATAEGLAELDDPEFVLEVVTTWMEAVTSVDTPLPKPSPGGGTTGPEPPMVASLPMAALPSSQRT